MTILMVVLKPNVVIPKDSNPNPKNPSLKDPNPKEPGLARMQVNDVNNVV